ncbi:hypothetical protein C0J45_18001 [Silurus meridionalis]|uniref:Uncharacterized protein n=1 Tax=Silurus meridionalis TaxID=175797 RepID=A0A8T0AK32_SILME|nr:hypothetical protein HF521_010942 [Silurus meridionalis]KAI5092370.1 hypothetical protein C0J45_18001 [Silurus meridionalis]
MPKRKADGDKAAKAKEERLHVHTRIHSSPHVLYIPLRTPPQVSHTALPGSGQSFRTRPASICAKPTDMIIRLGRLTPGYFRLLQRQVAGEVQTPPQDRSLNQIAMMLAIMGLSLSYYSAKQMTEKVQHNPVP